MSGWKRWEPIWNEGGEHLDHWHELPGFPTAEEFHRMRHDQEAMKRLEEDLRLHIADHEMPGDNYVPEPWWRES